MAAYHAIRAVVHIANQQKHGKAERGGKKRIPTYQIARHYGIVEGQRFLAKVLKPLVEYQILRSSKGPQGGYELAKPANKINLLEVIEAADGASVAAKTPSDPVNPNCPITSRLEKICQQITEQVRKELARIKISELTA